MNLESLLTRYYTKQLDQQSNLTVYDLFEWKHVDVMLQDYSTGAIILDMKNLEFPSHYSQSACSIIASKYFRKKGVPNKRNCEYSMKQVAHRLVSFWVEAAKDEGLFTDEHSSVVYDELVYMFLAQMWAPNSPQWFNTGLKQAYAIDSPPQGHYYYDEELGQAVLSKDGYTRTQGSACFIVSVEDSLLGNKSLTDQITTETRLFKFGSGVGSNWSSIRAEGEPLSGGGRSSGLLSFLKVFDRNAGAIKSGGTTRRAAKMNILDLDHPEILSYIDWKSKEEDKVRALGKMGYDIHFEGEAYDTVSGQNANNSVRIPNTFMDLLDQEDAMWTTKGRFDEDYTVDYPVKEVWDHIATAAWNCGDPGVQFDDIINDWHTCPGGEDGKIGAKYNRINGSNPCSEYMFLDDTACNLASINIAKFYDTTNNSFDIEGYLHAVKMIQIVLEATIHWGQFPTGDIARKSYLFRTTGLGLTNLGYTFMIMGLPYDSEESRTVASSLMSLLTGYSYYVSSLFAKAVGPFDCYEVNKDSMQKVMRNHGRIAGFSQGQMDFEGMSYQPLTISHDMLRKLKLGNLSDQLKKVWKDTLATGETYGYRNAQVSVLAPTGTIAFAMDCATTSSEPFFSHVAYKKLIGGGSMEIVNPAIPQALQTLGYTDEQINAIVDYVMEKEDMNGYEMIKDGKIEGAPYLKDQHLSVFDTANKCGSGNRYIAPEGHVHMMAALMPNVSGAISKTVNLPSEASTENIKEIYRLSWELGVKAIALYRDGCKASQPLNTTMNEDNGSHLEDLTYDQLLDYAKSQKEKDYQPIRKKPSGIRTAHVHEAEMAGLKLYITTSFFENGRLGEVYISAGRQGSLIKGLLDSLSTTISEMLQYGVPVKDIAKMYRGQKYEPSGFVTRHPYIKRADSISDLISKIIDIEMGDFTYCQVKPVKSDETATPPVTTSDEELTATAVEAEDSYQEPLYGELCPNCKSSRMVKNGTCKVCLDCGSTTGCS